MRSNDPPGLLAKIGICYKPLQAAMKQVLATLHVIIVLRSRKRLREEEPGIKYCTICLSFIQHLCRCCSVVVETMRPVMHDGGVNVTELTGKSMIN